MPTTPSSTAAGSSSSSRASRRPIHHESGPLGDGDDAKLVEGQAADLLGERADEIIRGPRATLGRHWNRDHRIALAATVIQG
jgi:hypothetical protein